MSLLLDTYVDETDSPELRVAVGILGAFALVAALIASYGGIRWVYARRRRPWAWVAISVLEATSREISPPVVARGIGSRGGNLAIRLPQGITNFINEGDSFLALNSHTREQLGSVAVVEVYDDSCICIVFDKMEHEEFWDRLESRMNRDFSPPSGVEFSRPNNQASFDLVLRQIRNWAG